MNDDIKDNINLIAEESLAKISKSENLNELEQKVLSDRADIGFATDPDGDRLSIVSNKGKAIGEEYTLVLAVKNFINSQESMVVTNLSTSMMLDNIAD